MLKKTIRYKDFDDNEVEEEFFFHLSKAKIIHLEATSGRDGLKGRLERLQREKDPEKILELLTGVIKLAYGKKSEDGRRFLQTEEVWNDFAESNAFSELLMEFFTEPQSFGPFITAIMPSDMQEQVAKMASGYKGAAGVQEPPPGPRPAVSEEPPRANVFEREAPHVPTESLMKPPPEAMSDQPAAKVLTEAEIREMDPVELQRGLVEGRYKLTS
jgi:hypothetical protein